MMNKIRCAIISYQYILDMNLAWIDVLDRALTDETKEFIEGSTLNLEIIAQFIKEAMCESSCKSDIDNLLMKKMKDQEMVISLMKET